MNNILFIDTCVWLDMAEKPSLKTLALALKQLLESNEIDILTTDIIEEEFKRNKDRVIDISRQKISQDINNVKSLIKKAAEGEDKTNVISSLDEVRHKLPSMSEGFFFCSHKKVPTEPNKSISQHFLVHFTTLK